jgi:hypothetical protein
LFVNLIELPIGTWKLESKLHKGASMFRLLLATIIVSVNVYLVWFLWFSQPQPLENDRDLLRENKTKVLKYANKPIKSAFSSINNSNPSQSSPTTLVTNTLPSSSRDNNKSAIQSSGGENVVVINDEAKEPTRRFNSFQNSTATDVVKLDYNTAPLLELKEAFDANIIKKQGTLYFEKNGRVFSERKVRQILAQSAKYSTK